jgi:Fusaric acid resistance protein-like
LPTYGAAARKMILRIVGAAIGGVISLLVIIIVSPNFSTLPAYLLATSSVFYISAYCALTSGRIAYAGKQIGTTFALVFTDLSPATDIYEPLWRIWSIFVGTFVVGFIVLILWPEYAGDSLLPRLRKVLLDTVSLAPGGSAANSEDEIQQTNSETMSTLAEILGVADDAQLEGRASLVDHNSIVQAAGTLRRIANRYSSIASGRIATPLPQLDLATESARAAFFAGIRQQLESWLSFFGGAERLSPYAAQATAQAHSRENLQIPLQEFSSRLEEQGFARIESWTLEQRRTILAELQSIRRLEFLCSDLNRWLAQIPGPAEPGSGRVLPTRTRIV